MVRYDCHEGSISEIHMSEGPLPKDQRCKFCGRITPAEGLDICHNCAEIDAEIDAMPALRQQMLWACAATMDETINRRALVNKAIRHQYYPEHRF